MTALSHFVPTPFVERRRPDLADRRAEAGSPAPASLSARRAARAGTGTSPHPVLGRSPELRAALDLALRAGSTTAPVLITGETGTGKELLAHYIHSHSARRRCMFVPVNCAALPEGLFESEMFGHCRGAFTGAIRDKQGLLETANGGTIFLDELSEMPTALQAKLLRVLQDGEVRRVGSQQTDAVVDVRVVSAMNCDTNDAIREGRLRRDLFYRLHVVPIHLPPLRERPEDIPLLAEHFLERYWTRYRGRELPVPTLSREAMWALSARGWPGNVRELQNTMEHLVVLADAGATIQPDQIPPCGVASDTPATAATPTATPRGQVPPEVFGTGYRAARHRVLNWFEMEYLNWLVRRAGGNFTEAARHAGIDRTTMYRLLKRNGVARRKSVTGSVHPKLKGLLAPDTLRLQTPA